MAVRASAEPRRRVRLRVEIDEQAALAGLGEAGGEVDAVVVFPTPPFWFAIA